MNSQYKMTVLSNDLVCSPAIPRTRSIRVLNTPNIRWAKTGNVFVLTTASKLPEFSDFVRTASQYHRLRALLIHTDIDANLLPQMLARANLRVLRNTLAHFGSEIPKRIITAWQHEMQDKLVATAEVLQDHLLVISCALETFEVSFDEVSALRNIPSSERRNFQISSEGSYIHWVNQDVHIDIESLQYLTNEKWRKLYDIKRMRVDKRFASAIAEFRKRKGKKQSDMLGLSERQVRRIESGEPPTVKALENLAQTYGLSLNQYLNEIALELKKTISK